MSKLKTNALESKDGTVLVNVKDIVTKTNNMGIITGSFSWSAGLFIYWTQYPDGRMEMRLPNVPMTATTASNSWKYRNMPLKTWGIPYFVGDDTTVVGSLGTPPSHQTMAVSGWYVNNTQTLILGFISGTAAVNNAIGNFIVIGRWK